MKSKVMAGMSRRNLLTWGAGIGLVVAWQRWATRSAPAHFEPIAGAPGWRFLRTGEVSRLSAGDLVTIGLDRDKTPPLPPARLDAVVHRDASGTGVKLALFGDFFCPWCRILFSRFAAWSGAPALDITWHELPLLGPNSVTVARAAEAANLQGGYVAFYNQLLQDGFRPAPRWLGQAAERAGLDGARVVADMAGPKVARRLDDSARAAAALGFFATPGTVIRRTALLGAIDRDLLRDLLAQEA